MQSMENQQNKILVIGKNYESYSYKLTSAIVSKLLNGFFLFKKRKGEILAGATTFFAVLSLIPSLLLFISILGFVTGDVAQSKAIVLETLNSNIPHLAPWILKSISSIVEGQLNSSTSANLMNIAFLGYSLIGLVSAFMYGVRTIGKKEAKGGFIIEDIKSFSIGSIMTFFMGVLLIISNKTLFKMVFFSKAQSLPEVTSFLFDYQVVPVLLSLGFFTLFYRFSNGKKISYSNSFLGAVAFVGCFLAGKSGYWIYLNSSKSELAQNYGNFYTIVMAAVWIYYLVCSFFYGASISNLDEKELYTIKPVVGKQSKSDLPPELPSVAVKENTATEYFKKVS
ncbi:YihY/virulence factor BrkB family protein [Halobacteriovorax sp. HLS]|uniref:YihY/virulence factor BrkB family protein n=1 Tax=Halobacteriovorax sp. HLS TaxID=2234000 RepID=UPI000FDC432F|nr:YihY/virulence factor BrkB family protein [Halobacteriovorax sp. HLS]